MFVFLSSKGFINNGFTHPFWKPIPWNKMLNDTRREKLCFTQFIVEEFTEIEPWLPLTVFICLHNQLISIHCIEYSCLKKVIHQIDSKNGRLPLPATFTAKFELVFVLTQESTFS